MNAGGLPWLVVGAVALFVLVDALAMLWLIRRASRSGRSHRGSEIARIVPARSEPETRHGLRTLALILVGSSIAAVTLVSALADALEGKVPDELRCLRAEERQCQILGSSGLGLTGRSVLADIPEIDVRSAESFCPRGGYGHGKPSCWVRLVLNNGDQRLVMNYQWEYQTQESAARINAFFHDPTRASFEERQNKAGILLWILGSILLVLGIAFLTAFVIARLRSRQIDR